MAGEWCAAQEYGTMPRKGGLREDFPFAINTEDMLQDICWDDQEILKILTCFVYVLAQIGCIPSKRSKVEYN